MYAIAGITGHTGSAAAELLLERKQRVRGIVRDERKAGAWKARGVELATASLDDPAALTRALSGVEGAYLLLPPDYPAPDLLAIHHRQTDAMARAVKESGVPHVVLLSSLGAELPAGTGPIRGMHYAEHALGRVAKNLTVLRAGYFLENWIMVLDPVRAEGLLPTFLAPGKPLAMVATRDIGRTAAELLLDPARGKRIVQLAGPRELTPEDVAGALGERLGRSVRVQGLPLDAAAPTFTSAGMSANSAALMREMFAAAQAGRLVFAEGKAELRRGALGPGEVLGPLLA
jgi:uncharacterized protein YbjT (DUF2867 family)